MFNRSSSIERLFEQMQKDMLFNMGSEASPYSQERFDIALGNVDGYRAELVDGELTEYIYEDGEWQEVGLDTEDDDDIQTEVMHSDGEDETPRTTFVADISTKVEDGAVVSEAKFNNGVLEVEFETTTAEEQELAE